MFWWVCIAVALYPPYMLDHQPPIFMDGYMNRLAVSYQDLPNQEPDSGESESEGGVDRIGSHIGPRRR
jgi:hypothetical protein